MTEEEDEDKEEEEKKEETPAPRRESDLEKRAKRDKKNEDMLADKHSEN